MVDQTLVEQATLDVSAKEDVKTNRRRTNKNRTRRPRKENEAPANESQDTKPLNEKPQRQRQRKTVPRAPRVRTEGETVEREKADYTDGILRLKISNARPRTVYTRLVRLMLAGFDGAGNSLEAPQPIHTIEVSALGNAIGSAIYVADNLIKGKVVSQTSMSADYVVVDGNNVAAAEDSKIKGSARLLMTLKREGSWEPTKDEVLNKTRVYRTKVLGLPEETKVAAE
jgi:hypothetical protein